MTFSGMTVRLASHMKPMPLARFSYMDLGMEKLETLRELFNKAYQNETIPKEKVWELLTGPLASAAGIAGSVNEKYGVSDQFSSLILLASGFKALACSALEETEAILEAEIKKNNPPPDGITE